jgi:hypothetical protein
MLTNFVLRVFIKSVVTMYQLGAPYHDIWSKNFNDSTYDKSEAKMVVIDVQ